MNEFPLEFLKSNALALAELVADSAVSRLQEHEPSDVISAFEAITAPERCSACDYSQKAVGPLYSLYFHGRRLHDAIWHIYLAAQELKLHPATGLLDYGTGTGAAVWAMALLHATGCLGFHANQLAIDAYDASDSMLVEAVALWRDFASRPQFRDVTSTVSVRWHSGSPEALQSPHACPSRFVTAGYVLSDPAVPAESNALFDYLARCNGNRLATWTSREKLNSAEVRQTAKKKGWTEREVPLLELFSIKHPYEGFWKDAVDSNPSMAVMRRLLSSWPKSDATTQFETRIERAAGKFAWQCIQPSANKFPRWCFGLDGLQ